MYAFRVARQSLPAAALVAGSTLLAACLDVGEVHGLAANVLMVAVLGHALMALYHQYVLKDGLLRRMMRAG